MVVVALVTMAMVIVLSAFNGIEDLIDQRYSVFDADLSIVPLESKVIRDGELPLMQLADLHGVNGVYEVIEERVFARNEQNQRIVKLKGISTEYLQATGIDSLIIDGSSHMNIDGQIAAVMGIGVKYDLDLRLFEQQFKPLQLSAIERGKNLRRNMESALRNRSILVNGIFSINIDFDSDYVLVPYAFAQDLLGYQDEYSTVEFRADPHSDLNELRESISDLIGDKYQVRTRFQKNEVIFKTNETEKWATFLIMGFILLIATFNIIAALSLLINEKREDIRILTSMGAESSSIKRIFLLEGALINWIGAGSGILLGLLFVHLQQHYGLIRLDGGLVDYYPVAISGKDLIAIFGLVVVCGFLSSIGPVQLLTKRYSKI